MHYRNNINCFVLLFLVFFSFKCSKHKGQFIKIQFNNLYNQEIFFDTIQSISRFTNYYQQKQRSYLLNHKNKCILKPVDKPYELLEISWNNKRQAPSNRQLIYKSDIQNSVFFFIDKPCQLEINLISGNVKGDDLSERNRKFLKFQKKLKNIYNQRFQLEQWADSIKDLPENDSLKKYVYNTYKTKRKSIQNIRDSLASYVKKLEKNELKNVISVMMNSMLPGKLKISAPKLDSIGLLDPKLHQSIESYRQFQKNPEQHVIPTIYDYTAHGETFHLNENLGKLTILDFWASYCGPCLRKSQNFLKPLYKQYHERGLEIVGVSLDKDIERWKETLRKQEYPWKNINCSEIYSPVKEWFNISDIPTLILLDKNGNIIERNPEKSHLIKIIQQTI
jgi:thiol-disulfide isomerase/thioredoxin